MLRIVILLLLTSSSFANNAEQRAEGIILDSKQNSYNLKNLAAIINEADNNVINCQTAANKIIATAKDNTSLNKLPQNEFLQDLILSSPAVETKTNDLFIFVSLSMPEHTLHQYAALSHKYNYTLVIQGFKNNSYLATVKHMQKIIQSTKAGIMVHPDLFQQFNIQQVPTFVLCNEKQYDKIAGNISVNYALTEIAEHGDLAALAKTRLEQL